MSNRRFYLGGFGALTIMVLLYVVASAVPIGTHTGANPSFDSVTYNTYTYATLPSPAWVGSAGTHITCSDCTATNPTSAGGTSLVPVPCYWSGPGGVWNCGLGSVDVGGTMDLCAHGLGCNAQVDFSAAITSGTSTLTITSTNRGKFTPASVGQKIKLGTYTATTGVDTYMGTIATYVSATSVTVTPTYTGTTLTPSTGWAEWGSGDSTVFTALINAIKFGNTLTFTPARMNCHAPIIADGPIVFDNVNAQFDGTGPMASMQDSINEDFNGCEIIDMNPTKTTHASPVDVVSILGNARSTIGNYSVEGSVLYPKRGLTTIHQSGHTSTQNKVYNIGNNNLMAVVPPTWGLTGSCAPAGNISGTTITCAVAPTGLQEDQYIYIYDTTTGYERAIATGISGSVITLATALGATHIHGQYTILYYPNPMALAGIMIPNDGANDDVNLWDSINWDYVDEGIDIRNSQAVTNTLRNYTSQNTSVSIGLTGADLSVFGMEQNNTSIGWIVDNNGRLTITNFAPQPASSIPANSMMFGWCGTGQAVGQRCSFLGNYIQWAQSVKAPVGGDFIGTGPATTTVDIDINQLQLGNSAIGATLGSQPTLHVFLVPGTAQVIDTYVEYDLAAAPPWLDYNYAETGTANANSFRHVRIQPRSSVQSGQVNAATDELLKGSDVYIPFRTDRVSNVRTWGLNVPQLTAHSFNTLTATGSTGTNYYYFAVECVGGSGGGCTKPSAGGLVSAAAGLNSSNYVIGSYIPDLGMDTLEVFRNSVNTASSALLQFIITLNQPPATTQQPGKISFQDQGNGIGSQFPPGVNATGGAVIGGLANVGSLQIQQTAVPTPTTTPVYPNEITIYDANGNLVLIPARKGAPTPTPTPTQTMTPTPAPT